MGVSPARALRAAPSVQVVRELAMGRARVQALAFPWALQRDFPSALPVELGTHCAFVFCHYSLPRSAGGWKASGPRVVHLVLPASPQDGCTGGCRQATLTTWWHWRMQGWEENAVL